MDRTDWIIFTENAAWLLTLYGIVIAALLLL